MRNVSLFLTGILFIFILLTGCSTPESQAAKDSLSKDESLSIMISAIVIGFVFAFREWNTSNAILAIIIVALSILFHIAAQKIAALKVGFKAEYKIWWQGLLFSLILI